MDLAKVVTTKQSWLAGIVQYYGNNLGLYRNIKEWLASFYLFTSQQSFQVIIIGIDQRDIHFAVGRLVAGTVQQQKAFVFSYRSAVTIGQIFYDLIGSGTVLYHVLAV